MSSMREAPGTIKDIGAAGVSLGHLPCDGATYPITTYPALFAWIGTAWNNGSEPPGSFSVPDIRGRATVGAGTGSGLSARTVGQAFGEETHTLAASESGLPSHAHDITPNPHSHQLGRGGTLPNTDYSVSGSGEIPASSLTSTQSLAVVAVGAQNASAGHNNIQPSAVVTKMIKY